MPRQIPYAKDYYRDKAFQCNSDRQRNEIIHLLKSIGFELNFEPRPDGYRKYPFIAVDENEITSLRSESALLSTKKILSFEDRLLLILSNWQKVKWS